MTVMTSAVTTLFHHFEKSLSTCRCLLLTEGIALETCLKAINLYIDKALNHGPKIYYSDNLTTQERQALMPLSEELILSLKPYKGLAVVVM